jgi:hypothetical protein
MDWLWQKLRGVFTENLGLKILAFAFALGLYAFSHNAQDAQRTMAVDVIATPPPEEVRRVLLTPLPPQIRVTVRGPRSVLDELRSEDLGSVPVDLRSGKANRVEFYPSMVHVPPSVRIEQVDPVSVELRWEDVIVRPLLIQASITGQPGPGLVMKGPPRVDPPSVAATGPRSVVEVLQYARADAFDVTGIHKEGIYDRTLAIDRPPTRVDYDTRTALVRIEVAREQMQRVFVKVPVEILGIARGSTTPPDVDVRVEGPPDLVRSLRPEQIVPTVDLKAASVNLTAAGAAMVEVAVRLEQCSAIVTPKLVKVRWQ